MKKLIVFIYLIGLHRLHGQVLNVESKRFYNDTSGWAGNIRFSMLYQYNNNRIFSFGNTVHLQYQKGMHRWIVLNDLNFNRSNGNQFVNTGYQHIRYNYRFHPKSRVAWEAFVQTQYNKPMKLDLRALCGTGPRFRIIRNDHFRMYIGTLYMLEYEQSGIHHDEFYTGRISSYLTFSWFISEHAEITSTTYYQPNSGDFRDYRIATDNALVFEFTKHFGFQFSGGLLFDTRQPEGVPYLTYRMEQKLTYSF